DFSSLAISGWMFSKVLKPMGFRLRDVFVPKVPRDVAVESLRFGVGVMLFVLSYESIGTIVAFIYSSFLPNYATYIGSLSILSPIIALSETVNGIHTGNHRSTVSEAYFNRKQNYAEYILSNGFRTIGQVTGLITPVVLVIIPAVISNLFPQYTTVFSIVFIPIIVHRSIFQHSHFMNEVLIGTGNHKFNILITIIEQVVGLTMVLICIYYQLGIYVLIVPGYFSTLVKQGAGWIFITKRIINLRFNPWQNWISTAMAGFVYFVLLSIINHVLNLVVPKSAFIIVFAIFVLLSIYVLPGIGYFLPLALLGGYDKNTLDDFEKAVRLSGPSKFVVIPWYKLAAIGARTSKLHGWRPMYYKNVAEEINELMLTKRAADTAHANENSRLSYMFE
nr:hypothetical protein [Candidatus Sigynarchaeota archaeon]